MMGKFLPFITVFFLLFSISLPAQDGDIDKDVSTCREAKMHFTDALLNLRGNEDSENFDLKYCRMDWTVAPPSPYIKGIVTSYFETVEDNFQALHFDLANALTVDSVLYHGQQVSANFVDPFVLKIDLPQALSSGVLDSVTIYYQGTPVSTGFGTYEAGLHNGWPIMWTLSEPYGSRDWWPCKQDLNDKIDSIDVYVRTSAGGPSRAASNGVLVGEWWDGNYKVFHWKHRYPIPAYLVAIAVGDYAYYSDWVPHPDGDIEVLNYVFPENLAQAQIQTQDIVEIMSFYNDISGRYPFADEKYGHAQFGWGGGMEHQTMSFMGGFNYSLQAHELAHQWFGDKVTCGSWADIWLNEGFATYWEALTRENLVSPQAWYDWKVYAINQVTSQPGGSVWVDDTTSVGRIFDGRLSYRKGATLLHMLRWILGDDDFFQACRNYLEDPNLAFGYAKTEDLQAHLEAVSGLDLTEFFADWFYGQGYPSYQLLWDYHNGKFFLIANQTTSHPSVSFFEMPLPIRLVGDTQDTLIRLEHTQNGQLFEVSLPWEVKAVNFDPDYWIVSAGNTVTMSPIDSALNQGLEDQIAVRPNPGIDDLEVAIRGNRLWMDRVRIFDASGGLIDDRATGHSISEKWDTANWPAGAYILFVQTSEGYAAKWWVKK
ncbi:MAG: M1 family metallopeptidase [Lewinellaceae bacterium]|nr:M1 family metallopeptidase [Lewinellaceae bacterium]